MRLSIYTDGGSHKNPGPGGWAYVIVGDNNIIAEDWGAEKDITNNRMEMVAVIYALERIAGLNATRNGITVFTDSQYVQKGMDEWIHVWKKKGWHTSEKKPVKNKDLWQKLDELAGRMRVKWQWVKGHAGDFYNERCDRMTQEAIRSIEERM